MYPERELNQLTARKALLQGRIALRRAACVRAATRVMEPLRWADRALAVWRRVSPLTSLAAVPLGLLVARPVFSRLKFIGPILRWGPLVFSALRGLRTGRV